MELIIKTLTSKENFVDKHAHSILQLFDILYSFLFTISEMKRDY